MRGYLEVLAGINDLQIAVHPVSAMATLAMDRIVTGGSPQQWSRWPAMVAAYKFDQDQAVTARALNPLLRGAGLAVELEVFLIYPAMWRAGRPGARLEVAMRLRVIMLTQCFRVMVGYPICMVRLGMSGQVRHIEADVVICDREAAGRTTTARRWR